MKKTSLALVAIALLGGIVMFSAFTPEKKKQDQKDPVHLYFRFIPANNSESAFETAGSWEYEGTTNPGAICGLEGPDACIVELPEDINPGIDPGTQTAAQMEAAFADYLLDLGVNDFTFTDASAFVEANVKAEKQ